MSGNLSSDNRGKGQQPSTGSEAASLGSSVGNDARVSAREAQLTKAGFSAEQIATIREKVADLDVKIIEPMAGDDIKATAKDAVKLCKETGSSVVFKFNDTVMVVSQGDTKEQVVAAYMAPIEAAHKAYWTPERVAEKEAKEAAFKAEMKAAYDKLPQFFKDWIAQSEGKNYGRELDTGIAKDAHLVATTLKTPDAIEKWYKLGYEEQMKAVPGMSDGHSGFSFSQMAGLAVAYLKSESAKV